MADQAGNHAHKEPTPIADFAAGLDHAQSWSEAELNTEAIIDFAEDQLANKIARIAALEDELRAAKVDAGIGARLVIRINEWMGEGRSHAERRPIDLMPLGLANEIHLFATGDAPALAAAPQSAQTRGEGEDGLQPQSGRHD